MKNLVLLFLFAFLLGACGQEQDNIELSENVEMLKRQKLNEIERSIVPWKYESIEVWQEAKSRALEEAGIEITVEHATLEELNKVMVENGLEPFTQSDIDRASSRSKLTCGPYPCSTWNQNGDWNDDLVLSTLDMVKATQYVCNYGVPCAYLGGYVDTYYQIDQDPDNEEHWEALEFSTLSHWNCVDGLDYIINQDDLDAGRDFILLKITCN